MSRDHQKAFRKWCESIDRFPALWDLLHHLAKEDYHAAQTR
jgi:hypothetical protein